MCCGLSIVRASLFVISSPGLPPFFILNFGLAVSHVVVNRRVALLELRDFAIVVVGGKVSLGILGCDRWKVAQFDV